MFKSLKKENKIETPAYNTPAKLINDSYRIGYDSTSERITLTLIDPQGMSITLMIPDNEVDRLVRLLQAARNDNASCCTED